jgi:hypothetical protein
MGKMMGQKAHCKKCGAELRASLVCGACGDDPLESPGVEALLKAPFLQPPEEPEAENKKPRRPEG